MNAIQRCQWANPKNQTYLDYHDQEWGVPLHDEQKMFEFLVLETFQAGLSWETILNKREAFRKAFDNFDYNKVAVYGEDKVRELMQNHTIIRYEKKIRAAISNAQAFLEVQKTEGGFCKYLWDFAGGDTLKGDFESSAEIPAKTALSDALAADLKKRGFKFIGSTVCYAHLQAVGILNDHLKSCFRREQVGLQ